MGGEKEVQQDLFGAECSQDLRVSASPREKMLNAWSNTEAPNFLIGGKKRQEINHKGTKAQRWEQRKKAGKDFLGVDYSQDLRVSA
jgi:hypothetical protein